MIQRFLQKYREAFGEAAPLPIAFGYSDTPAVEGKKVPRCMIGAIRKVCEGEPLTLTAQNVLCGGGSLYTAFAPMQERIPAFVSETEHYKQTREQVKAFIDKLDIRLTEKLFLNFVRMDRLTDFDSVKVSCSSLRPTGFPACAPGLSLTTMPTMPSVPVSLRDAVALWLLPYRKTGEADGAASSVCWIRRPGRWFRPTS